MADSGARGSKQQIRQLAGMRGLMAKPSGEIIETPITSNFREGLTVLQYFISTHGARKGLADTALKTADSGYLTRRLVDVAQDVIISEPDCGTLDGIEARAIIESGEVIEPLRDRIIGRVTLEKLIDPFSGDIIIEANQEIDEDLASAIQDAGIEKVKMRSVLTCASRRGVCAKCYGRDLATGKLVELGIGGRRHRRAVDRRAGHAADDADVPHRRHGVAGLRAVDGRGEERRHRPVPEHPGGRGEGRHARRHEPRRVAASCRTRRGATASAIRSCTARSCACTTASTIESGQMLVEWDPYTFSILTEEPGQVRFKDILEGMTVHEEVDEVTGLSRLIIMDSPDEKKQPAIEIRTLDAQGHPTSKVSRKYHMPSHSHLMVSDGETVFAGDVLAKIPRETTKTKDITGGLPRVVELFEARKPRETAVISEIDGIVKHGAVVKGLRKIMIVPDEPGAEPREYSLPRGVHVNVQEGERVRAGEPLMDGPSNPHDILNVLGEKELQKYLVNEIQEVYRLQGVNINDKHIEVISRQMMRWVKIEDVGDTEFLIDEQVDKFRFLEENERVLTASGRPATGRPLLLGITKASLSTDSFISAASFQETTRVLTEASISGRIDYLRGLKENVTMGRLIPAGTGLRVLPGRADPGGRAAAAAGSAAADRGRSRAGSGDGVPHRAGRGAWGRGDDRVEKTKNEERIKHRGRVWNSGPAFFCVREGSADVRSPTRPGKGSIPLAAGCVSGFSRTRTQNRPLVNARRTAAPSSGLADSRHRIRRSARMSDLQSAGQAAFRCGRVLPSIYGRAAERRPRPASPIYGIEPADRLRGGQSPIGRPRAAFRLRPRVAEHLRPRRGTPPSPDRADSWHRIRRSARDVRFPIGRARAAFRLRPRVAEYLYGRAAERRPRPALPIRFLKSADRISNRPASRAVGTLAALNHSSSHHEPIARLEVLRRHDGLRLKYPGAAREWGWQWVFPATRFYVDRETGERRRYHLHESVGRGV